MRNFKKMQMKPTVSKNLSRNFLHCIRHSMGHIGLYSVVSFAFKSMVKKKPMVHFVKITLQGGMTCSSTLQKVLCCDCRRFLTSYLSAKAHGGRGAKAAVFPSRSKLARALQLGEARIFSPFWKKLTKVKRYNDPRRRHFVFLCFPCIVSAFSPETTGAFQSGHSGPIRGP